MYYYCIWDNVTCNLAVVHLIAAIPCYPSYDLFMSSVIAHGHLFSFLYIYFYHSPSPSHIFQSRNHKRSAIRRCANSRVGYLETLWKKSTMKNVAVSH
jgi:hypothetical protein